MGLLEDVSIICRTIEEAMRSEHVVFGVEIHAIINIVVTLRRGC